MKVGAAVTSKPSRMKKSILANAIWNVVNGSSSAVVAVLVPPFLTRALTPEAYGAWALALQIGTYVSLFGFGIQMAVGRYVAFAEARGDDAKRDGIVASAFWFLAGASVVGWAAIGTLAIFISHLLPNLSPSLMGQTRWAIMLVGLALAINLPASVFAAVFTGMQRSDVPAKIQGVGRLVQAAALIGFGYFQDLAILGIVYTAVSVGTILTLYVFWRTRSRAPTVHIRHVSGVHGRELFTFCISLTLWNLAMMMVTGLDLIFVGRYDYAATAYYAVCATLVTLVSGTLSSLSSALVPAAASLVDDDGQALRALLARASRLIMGASVMAAAPLIFSGHVILQWWLGSRYAANAGNILVWLALATLIRNALLPYVTLSIGIGYQGRMIVTPLIEGVFTVIFSLTLAQVYGAEGVAMAKIVGGSCGMMLLLVQHAMRDRLSGLTRARFLVDSVLTPAMAILPAALLTVILDSLPGLHIPGLLVLIIITSVTAISVWFIALKPDDRAFAVSFLDRRGAGASPPKII